jgi:hypothetical protein
MRKIHAELRYLKFESGSEQGFDVGRVLNRLDVLSRKAEELGRFATAIRCERLIGKYCGMFAARSNHTSARIDWRFDGRDDLRRVDCTPVPASDDLGAPLRDAAVFHDDAGGEPTFSELNRAAQVPLLFSG